MISHYLCVDYKGENNKKIQKENQFPENFQISGSFYVLGFMNIFLIFSIKKLEFFLDFFLYFNSLGASPNGPV